MLVQIWRSTKNFRGEAKVSTFVYQICINTALSFRAKIGRDKKRFETLDGKIFAAPAPDISKDERLQKLYAAIRELKPVDRAIVSLYLDEPLVIPAVPYGLDFFNKPSVSFARLIFLLIILLIIYEILIVIGTEIYFKILYTSASSELKNLLRQLDFDEN